jgi:hypothetical protein
MWDSRGKNVMELFRQSRQDYLEQAREVAIRLCRENGSATVDEVRKELPIPSYIKPSVMSGVFIYKYFTPIRYEKSTRAVCGFRPIVRWKLREEM